MAGTVAILPATRPVVRCTGNPFGFLASHRVGDWGLFSAAFRTGWDELSGIFLSGNDCPDYPFHCYFSTISVIEDRREGFLLSVLVAPMSRSGLALGKILGGATLAFIQGLLFVLVAPFIGIPMDLQKKLK